MTNSVHIAKDLTSYVPAIINTCISLEDALQEQRFTHLDCAERFAVDWLHRSVKFISAR